MRSKISLPGYGRYWGLVGRTEACQHCEVRSTSPDPFSDVEWLIINFTQKTEKSKQFPQIARN